METAVAPRLRLGLIIPSSNRLTEPQFNRYAPEGVGIHVTRLRMTGAHHAPVNELMPRIIESGEMLADAQCDVIVFHCTASSMEEGVETDRRIVEAIRRATGRHATSTASALLEALRAVEARRVVLLTPYVRETHEHEIAFLTQAGFEVVGERCLGLAGSDAYVGVPPAVWVRTAQDEQEPSADAYVLGCTNIHSIDVVEEIEARVGRPTLTSNQAVLWQALRLGGVGEAVPGLGRLLQLELPIEAIA